MSNIGRMRHRMAVQSYAEIQDDTFQNTPTWTTIYTVFAEIAATKGRVYFNGQQVDENITHKITIRYQKNFTSELWLLMDSRRFRVRRVKDIQERHIFLELMCEEVFIAETFFTSDVDAAEDPLAENLPAVY